MSDVSLQRQGASVPTELVARLEVASAGSNALDIEVLCLLDGFAYEKRDWDKAAHLYHSDGRRRESLLGGAGAVADAYKVTRSLDAAFGLAERVLPGWCWEVRIDSNGAGVQGAGAWWSEGLASVDQDGVAVEGPTPPLALCLAILKAAA